MWRSSLILFLSGLAAVCFAQDALGKNERPKAIARAKPAVRRRAPKPKPKPSEESTQDDGTFDWNVALGMQGRVFPNAPAYSGQSPATLGVSGILKPQFVWQSSDQRRKFELIPFLRVDQLDSRRTHFDLREASYTHAWGAFEVSAGFKNVFWGVTESQQLVNVLNQIDLVEDYRGRNRLGQPMVTLSYASDLGTWSAYLATGFRERTFPGTAGRLRGELPVDSGAQYESSMKQWQPDLALRWQHSIGSLDVGLYQFHGTSREPDAVVSSGKVLPYYSLIDQTGLDMQLTTGSLLTKFEGIFNARNQFANTYFGMTGGFEYTFFQFLGTDADLGTILEYSYDSRGALSTHLNQDVFGGMRLGLNDLDNTALLSGVIYNLQGKGAFLLLEASRRFGQDWSMAVSSALFSTIQPGSHPFAPLRRDDHLGLTLTYFLH